MRKITKMINPIQKTKITQLKTSRGIERKVTVNIPLTYTNGDTSVVIADVINGIVPCLLPLLFTGFIYWLVTKKKMKTTWALILIFIIGILGSLTGILGV